MRRRIIYGLSMFILTFVLVEALLRIVDPLGLYYFSDNQTAHSAWVGEFYVPVPGRYELTHTTITIQADHTRLVPDTNLNALCTIAFIGDSVTYGAGVNDDETFANRIAQAIQGVHFINAARAGTNSADILAYKSQFEADGYIYMITDNDPMDNDKYMATGTQITFYDVLYIERLWKWFLITREYEHFPTDYPRFWRDLAAIAAEDTLVFYNTNSFFEEPITDHLPTAIGLDWHYARVSVVDGHPDAAGHREAARLMLPYVQEFVDRICE